MKERGTEFLEFLRVPSMSVGIYALPVGGVDAQTPHAEDEIYYVLRGRAGFRVGEEDLPVAAGDVLFVPAHREHRFHDIRDPLELLVVFAPAESEASNPVYREGMG